MEATVIAMYRGRGGAPIPPLRTIEATLIKLDSLLKGWLDDAHHEVMAAASDPNGRLDAEVWFLLTLLNIQRCLILLLHVPP